jgi:hypothetical protein
VYAAGGRHRGEGRDRRFVITDKAAGARVEWQSGARGTGLAPRAGIHRPSKKAEAYLLPVPDVKDKGTLGRLPKDGHHPPKSLSTSFL